MAQSLSPPRSQPPYPDERVETIGMWFGAPARPALGWLSRPSGATSASAILVLPPVGYEYLSSHRTLRVLSERLASQGHLALRIDYDGSGDSAGDQWDQERLDSWRGTVRAAIACLRHLGATHLALVGVGLGAMLALLDAGSLNVERIVALYPVLSGRRYARQLRLLSTLIPEDEDPLEPAGTHVFAGHVFSAQTLAELSGLSVSDLEARPARAVLMIGDSGAVDKGAAHLRTLGAEVDHLAVEDGERVLDVAPEFAVVPERIVSSISAWLGSAPSHGVVPTATAHPATLKWRDGEICEEVMKLGPQRHVAIMTSADAVAPGGLTLLLLNSGSETHVGPGRAWVEYARSLALLGHRTVRADFRGWGESPDAGRAPGRPYDATCEEETVALVEALRAAGHQRIVIFGLCAAAWIGLRAVLHSRVAGVIAMNPQLYWKPGDPVDIDWQRIRSRRSDEIRRVDRGHRLGLWSALDALGHRPRVTRWLEDVAGTGVPVELLFSDGDDGITYLRQRAGRCLARVQRGGTIRIEQLAGIDHPMHLTWRRDRVVDALHGALEWIETVGAETAETIAGRT